MHIHIYMNIILSICLGSYDPLSGFSALQTEGIFRLSGSAKRVAALQQVFDDPIRGYGANVDWEGNTVHDVATLMRRFLNQLPDPVITHKYYQAFRDVMSK